MKTETTIAKKDNSLNIIKDKENAKIMQTGTKSEAQKAFNQIYKHYHLSMLFFVRKFRLEEEVVEDLVQEIFIKVFLKIDLYDFSSAFSTWLYNIATYHVIDYKRKKKFEVLSIDGMMSERNDDEGSAIVSYQIKDESDDVFKILSKKQMAEMVRASLSKVKSESGRQVINLLFLEDLAYAETAKQMNIPLGTVKAIMVRTKKELEKQIIIAMKRENFNIATLYGKNSKLKK